MILEAMRAALAAKPNEALSAEARELVRMIAASHPDETTRALSRARGHRRTFADVMRV
jgi:hypothetical protein